MKFKSDIEVQAGIKDSSGNAGTSGQVLSSNGATVSWVDAGSSVASDVQNEVKAGVAINKGQAVYVTGADGTNIIVGLASYVSEATSSKTLGLLDATVAANGFANVVQIGRLEGLNTMGANAGDPVWLGPDGNLIYGLTNKPYAPLHLVFIGIVTRVNANNGEIFVNVQNGFELQELHNVDLETDVPINGDVLGYDGTLWVNKTIAEWLGYTPADDATVVKLTGDQTISGVKTFWSNILVGTTEIGVGDNTSAVVFGSGAKSFNYGVSIGVSAGASLISGENNIALGASALFGLESGNRNIAIGSNSLTQVITGADNICIGDSAGQNILGSNNVIIGAYLGNDTMNGNIILADGEGSRRFWWDGTDIRLFGNLKVEGQARSIYSEDVAVTGTKTLNFNEGNIAFYTLTGSTTITLSNAIAGSVYTIRLTQGGSGSYTVMWDPVVKWGGGTTPTLSTAVGAIDIVTLLYDGTNFYGNIVKKFA